MDTVLMVKSKHFQKKSINIAHLEFVINSLIQSLALTEANTLAKTTEAPKI